MITQDYKLARSILSFIAGIGWIAVFMGVALAMTSIAADGGWPTFAIYGVACIITGLGLVLAAQLASAQIDTAESTRKLVELMTAERDA